MTNIDNIEHFLKIVDLFPTLKEMEPSVVKNYYALIARYAPTVATEPLLVGPLLKGIVMMGTFDLSIMTKLIEAERLMAVEAKRRWASTRPAPEEPT